MEKIEISPETQHLINTATDREIQNQIYLTLRGIEIRQDQSVRKLATIAAIAVIFLTVSIIGAFILAVGIR